MKRLSTKRLIVLIAAIATCGIALWIYVTYYHIDSPQREFLAAIRTKLSTSNNRLMVKDIHPSEWTRICLLSSYDNAKHTSSDELNRVLGTNDPSVKSKVPLLSELGQYNGAFVFLTESQIAEVISLKMPYIETPAGKLPYGLSKTRHYKDRCMQRDAAYFSVQGKKLVLDDQP